MKKFAIVSIQEDGTDGAVIDWAEGETAAEAERVHAAHSPKGTRSIRERGMFRAILPGVPVATAKEIRAVDVALVVDGSDIGQKALNRPEFVFHVPATWIAAEMRKVAAEAWEAGRNYGEANPYTGNPGCSCGEADAGAPGHESH